jgi:hypothetical protein
MDLNFFVAGTIHVPYQYFSDEDTEAIHFDGRRKTGLAEEPAAYQNSNAIVTCSASKHLSMSTTLEDRPRVSHHRAHTSVYVEYLVQATYIRHQRQRSAFMFPLPRRAGDPVVAETWSNMGLRIGGTQCLACENNPSHTLAPCGHTICYDHFLQHAEDLPVRCALCLKVSLFLDLSSIHNLSTLSHCARTRCLLKMYACSPLFTIGRFTLSPLRTLSVFQSHISFSLSSDGALLPFSSMLADCLHTIIVCR